MRFSIVLAALALASFGHPAAAQTEAVSRAEANYRALLAGTKAFTDLTPAERDEIRALDKRVRGLPLDERDSVQRCLDEEFAKLGRAPSDLDKRVIDTRCR